MDGWKFLSGVLLTYAVVTTDLGGRPLSGKTLCIASPPTPTDAMTAQNMGACIRAYRALEAASIEKPPFASENGVTCSYGHQAETDNGKNRLEWNSWTFTAGDPRRPEAFIEIREQAVPIPTGISSAVKIVYRKGNRSYWVDIDAQDGDLTAQGANKDSLPEEAGTIIRRLAQEAATTRQSIPTSERQPVTSLYRHTLG